MRWSRAAEFTCDRAAILVSQDVNVVVSTLLKLAGGSVSQVCAAGAWVLDFVVVCRVWSAQVVWRQTGASHVFFVVDVPT